MFARLALKRINYSHPPVLLIFSLVTTQSLSWQLYRMKFKLLPVERIYVTFWKRLEVIEKGLLTLRPNASPTNIGSIFC